MILSRQSVVAFLLMAAVVCLFFAPLLPAHGATARHHSRTIFGLALWAMALAAAAWSLLRSSLTRKACLQRAENLLELHCTRLC